MAKKKGKGGGNKNGYFQKQIQQNGQNFLEFKNARNLENDSMMIFRELAAGKIDIQKYGDYLLDDNLLNACILSATNKYKMHAVSYNGVNLLIGNATLQYGSADPYYFSVLEYHKRRMEAYGMLINGFNNIKMTKDKAYIFTLSNSLSYYRNDFY